MLDNLSHFEFLTVAGALVAGWIKFQNDYGRLSARVHALETDNADACYYKVKAGEKVFPSAYASGRIAKCRKMGAANYGKGKK